MTLRDPIKTPMRWTGVMKDLLKWTFDVYTCFFELRTRIGEIEASITPESPDVYRAKIGPGELITPGDLIHVTAANQAFLATSQNEDLYVTDWAKAVDYQSGYVTLGGVDATIRFLLETSTGNIDGLGAVEYDADTPMLWLSTTAGRATNVDPGTAKSIGFATNGATFRQAIGFRRSYRDSEGKVRAKFNPGGVTRL